MKLCFTNLSYENKKDKTQDKKMRKNRRKTNCLNKSLIKKTNINNR